MNAPTIEVIREQIAAAPQGEIMNSLPYNRRQAPWAIYNHTEKSPVWSDSKNPLKPSEAFEAAGANFTHELRPVKALVNGEYVAVPKTQVLVRNAGGFFNDEAMLGPVGKRYVGIQNMEMARLFDKLPFPTIAAGAMANGARSFILMQVYEDQRVVELRSGRGDGQQIYLLVREDKARGALTMGIMTIRMWCTNMLASVSPEYSIRVMHNRHILTDAKWASKVIGSVGEMSNRLIGSMNTLAQKDVDSDTVKAFLNTLFKTPAVPDVVQSDLAQPYPLLARPLEAYEGTSEMERARRVWDSFTNYMRQKEYVGSLRNSVQHRYETYDGEEADLKGNMYGLLQAASDVLTHGNTGNGALVKVHKSAFSGTRRHLIEMAFQAAMKTN